MKIFVYPRSRSIRATWAAEELGLTYLCQYADVMAADNKIPSKTRKVPLLIDNEDVIFESLAICCYLAEEYGKGKLYPAENNKKAIVNQWLAYIISELESPLWNILKHSIFLPEEKRIPQFIEQAKAEYLSAVKIVENEIANNEYLCHNEFTLADIFLTNTSRWALSLGMPISEALTNYTERCEQRAAFKQAQKREEEAKNLFLNQLS